MEPISVGYEGVTSDLADSVVAFCRKIPYVLRVKSLHVQIVPSHWQIADSRPIGGCQVMPTSIICSGRARLLSSFEFGGVKPTIRVAATPEVGNTTTVTLWALSHALAHYEQFKDRKEIRHRGVELRVAEIIREVARINFCRYCGGTMQASPTVFAENPFCLRCLADRPKAVQHTITE